MYFDPETTLELSSSEVLDVWSIDQFKAALIDCKVTRVHINPTAQVWYDNVLCHVLAERCTFAIFVAVINRRKNGSFSRTLAAAIRVYSLLKRKV